MGAGGLAGMGASTPTFSSKCSCSSRAWAEEDSADGAGGAAEGIRLAAAAVFILGRV